MKHPLLQLGSNQERTKDKATGYAFFKKKNGSWGKNQKASTFQDELSDWRAAAAQYNFIW